MSTQIQFRIRELMAERERVTGERVSYRTLQKALGISPNTLSKMAQGKMKKIGLNVITELLDYFNCEIDDLIVVVRSADD